MRCCTHHESQAVSPAHTLMANRQPARLTPLLPANPTLPGPSQCPLAQPDVARCAAVHSSTSLQRDKVYAERRRALEASDLTPLMIEYAERTIDDILEVRRAAGSAGMRQLLCWIGCAERAVIALRPSCRPAEHGAPSLGGGAAICALWVAPPLAHPVLPRSAGLPVHNL